MTSVWPALWPPWKRTTTSARSLSQSTILPLPSSPHCEPTTTTFAIIQSSPRKRGNRPASAGPFDERTPIPSAALVWFDCGRIAGKSNCPYITGASMTKPHETQNSGIFARMLDQPYLLLVLAPLFWGGNVVAAKLVVGEIDPFLLLAARCVLATAVILPFAWRFLGDDWPVIRRTWLLLMAYGAIGYALFNVFLYVGLQTTTGVNS